jgi:HrpA-like RNA helicase
VKKALEMLWILGALAKDGSLSELGKQMALFPLEPLYSRVLIASQQFKCTDEVTPL